MSDQPRTPQVEILRDYRSEHIHFRAGETVSIARDLAEQLILSDYAQYVDDEFDRELERITRESPEAVKRMIAWADADLAAGRCEPMETLCEEERKRRKASSIPRS
jgi:hypothetical protein